MVRIFKKTWEPTGDRFPNVEITLNRYPEGERRQRVAYAKNPMATETHGSVVNLDSLEKIPPTVDDLDLFKEKDPLVPVV